MSENNWTTTAAESLKNLLRERDSLLKQIAGAEKRLAEEINLKGRHERNKAELLEASKRTLAGETGMSYLKFRQDMVKNQQAIEVAGSAIETLRAELLPTMKGNLKEVEKQLRQSLATVCLERKAEVESGMMGALSVVVDLFHSFLMECRGLYDQHGEAFSIGNPGGGLVPYRFIKRLHSLDSKNFADVLQKDRQTRIVEPVPPASVAVSPIAKTPVVVPVAAVPVESLEGFPNDAEEPALWGTDVLTEKPSLLPGEDTVPDDEPEANVAVPAKTLLTGISE